jgi:hypothetical protein
MVGLVERLRELALVLEHLLAWWVQALVSLSRALCIAHLVPFLRAFWRVHVENCSQKHQNHCRMWALVRRLVSQQAYSVVFPLKLQQRVGYFSFGEPLVEVSCP